MIRLQRTGRTNDAAFRIVVTEKARAAKTGKVVEYVGSYHPKTKAVTLKKGRVEYWMSVGAKPSDTLTNLLIEQKVISGKKINVLPKKTVEKKEGVVQSAPATEGASAAEEPVAEAGVDASSEEVLAT
jgi:small subunit ribosomal protein S16